jgi:peroxiredoxin Q/BCP
MALKVGSKAPDLKLTDESCEFRDHSAAFAGKDAVIIGISPDAEKAQSKFKTKFELPFTLLADFEHAGAEAYGVWKEKSMYGKTYMGVERTTFVIGPDGKIKQIFEKVKPAGHAAEVLAAI